MQPIETLEFWREEFEITEEDREHLYAHFLETGVPHTTEELVRLIIQRRVQQVEKTRQAQLTAEGTVFQPRESYEVGQWLVFPALGEGVAGEVIGVRPGENPEYGDFKVIQVALEGDGIREFAAEFPLPHVLNIEERRIDLEQLCRSYGDLVRDAVLRALGGHPDYVRYSDQWLLQGLLADVHVGHLNIAEAMIVIAGEPLPTERLLEEIELPEDIPLETQLFSLNLALHNDRRFTNVGAISRPLWALAYQQEAAA